MSMTDGDAIQRVVGGDVEAFGVLLDRYHTPCLRYARRLLGNSETAEEVVQDTFLRAFRGLGGYDHRDHFRAWLFRILVNRCRTVAAAEKKRHLVVTTPDRGTVEGAAGPESHAGDASDRRREIDGALLRLARESREAFLLKYVEEMSYEEMSRTTGDSVSALKMRVLRARAELREILGSRHGNGR